jgi:DNA-binding NarL/FixJ family response regulator
MITVGIIEDHPVTREGFATIIESDPDLHLIATANDYESSLDWTTPIPEVVVLDLVLPGLSGANAVLALRQRGTRTLVVSMIERRDTVVEAVAAGAHGYLTKQAEPDEFTTAIKTVAADGMYVSPTLAGYLLRSANDPALQITLTERETQVLELLAQGETNRSIARALHISDRTVGDHVTAIRRKLEVVYGPVTRTRMGRLWDNGIISDRHDHGSDPG